MPRTFQMLKTLGRGTFGVVHLAQVTDDDDFVQTLAVKWLLPEWSQDRELLARLRDEARLLALLNHDNIVRVHGLTRIEGRLAIVMEPVEGADLSALLPAGVPPRAAVELIEAVALALDAAFTTRPTGQDQALGVVHRDIKPSNIMLTRHGAVKVMDFGVARATFLSREAETRSQQFGTARYMAPERWLDGVAEAPSDVFSLGVTAYEMLTGGEFERPRLSRESFAQDLATSLASMDAPAPVHALVVGMLSYDAADRPTAAQVAMRCHDLARELPGPGLRAWAAEHVDDPAGSRTDGDGAVVIEDSIDGTWDFATEEATAAQRAPRSHPPTQPTLADPRESRGPLWALAAVVALAVAAWAAWQGHEPAPLLQAASPAPVVAPVEAEPATVDPPPAVPRAVPEPAAAVESSTTPERSAPAAAPEPTEPPAAAGGATTTITFVPATPTTRVSIADAAVALRRGVPLDRGSVVVQVSDGERATTCTIWVDAAPQSYRVDAVQGCSVGP